MTTKATKSKTDSRPGASKAELELVRQFERQLMRNYVEAFREPFPGKSVAEALSHDRQKAPQQK